MISTRRRFMEKWSQRLSACFNCGNIQGGKHVFSYVFSMSYLPNRPFWDGSQGSSWIIISSSPDMFVDVQGKDLVF